MCSLEMETSHGLDGCEDYRLEDIFSDIERYDFSRSMSFEGLEEAFDLVEWKWWPSKQRGTWQSGTWMSVWGRVWRCLTMKHILDITFLFIIEVAP